MKGILRSGRMPAALLSVALILVTFGGLSVSAHERALVGGERGALLGAGTGAGTVYLIQGRRGDWRRSNWRRHHRNWRREHRYWRR